MLDFRAEKIQAQSTPSNTGTKHLEAARDHRIDQFVFSSTCAMYGVPHKLPITEDMPQRPINPCGTSKLIVEWMITDFGAAHDLRSVILRYFNAAGADPDGEIGASHDPETHLVPLVLDAASGRRPDVTIFGTDCATKDGTCVRDYIHLSDLADAHVKALDCLGAGGSSGVYNLGNGTRFSVREVVDAVEKVTGIAVPTRYGARRVGDPDALISDASNARQQLGWQPALTDLNDIIETAWAWHQRGSMLKPRRDVDDTRAC